MILFCIYNINSIRIFIKKNIKIENKIFKEKKEKISGSDFKIFYVKRFFVNESFYRKNAGGVF